MADNVEIMAIELGITADPSIKIVQSIGSVLHGVLMELFIFLAARLKALLIVLLFRICFVIIKYLEVMYKES